MSEELNREFFYDIDSNIGEYLYAFWKVTLRNGEEPDDKDMYYYYGTEWYDIKKKHDLNIRVLRNLVHNKIKSHHLIGTKINYCFGCNRFINEENKYCSKCNSKKAISYEELSEKFRNIGDIKEQVIDAMDKKYFSNSIKSLNVVYYTSNSLCLITPEGNLLLRISKKYDNNKWRFSCKHIEVENLEEDYEYFLCVGTDKEIENIEHVWKIPRKDTIHKYNFSISDNKKSLERHYKYEIDLF
ncbi:MAG: hypothetical protein ACOCQD_00110 [archaeon]